MKKLLIFLTVFLFPLLAYPATAVYENGTLKGYVNAFNFTNATVTKQGIVAKVDIVGVTGPAGSNATVAVANATVNMTQPMFKFIAGQNVSSIDLVNDTTGKAVNVTINVIDTNTGGNPFDQVVNQTSNITVNNLTATDNVQGATYGSDASVSDAELLYINNLSSNVQNQLAAKLAISGTGAGLTAPNLANGTGVLPVASLAVNGSALTNTNAANATGILNITTVNATTVYEAGVRVLTIGGTGATLTNIPAPNITGTIPAASYIAGGHLTPVPGANITGAVPAASWISAGHITGVNFVNVTNHNNTTDDTAYGAGWDTNTTAPSKNSVYDQMELKENKSGTGAGLTGLNLNNTTGSESKSFGFYNITTNNDVLLWKAPRAITIIGVYTVCTGGTSVTGTIAECNSTGQACVDSNVTWVTSAGTEATSGTPTDAAIDAGDWLLWNTSAVSGTPSNFAVTIYYNT